MKKSIVITMSMGIFALLLTSCGGSTGTSDDALLFGKVPGIVERFNAEKENFKSKASNISSEKELAALVEKSEKLSEETFEKAQKAAEAWSGTTLDITPDDSFTIVTPLTVTFKDFFSKLSMTPQYTVAGEIKVAKDYICDISENLLGYYHRQGGLPQQTVDLVGFDAEGNEVVSEKIGYVQCEFIGEQVGVPAGTIVKLESLVMSSKRVAEYPKVKSLKLMFKD